MISGDSTCLVYNRCISKENLKEGMDMQKEQAQLEECECLHKMVNKAARLERWREKLKYVHF